MSDRIIVSAPAKIVVSGEYAVLAGAPALVQALNRRVVCRLQASPAPRDPPQWRVESLGFTGASRHTKAALSAGTVPADDPAHLLSQVLRALHAHAIDTTALPAALALTIDSRACYQGRAKLGVGASAAVCVALTRALLTLRGASEATQSLAVMQAAHRAAQGGRGSGLDVAAAYHGGLIRYRGTRAPRIEAAALPTGLGTAFVFTGASTRTGAKLRDFATWRAADRTHTLDALCAAAESLARAIGDAPAFMAQLRRYVDCLAELDRAAALGIFSEPHRQLARIAESVGVIYKPCGAGGGDVGMAFAVEPAAVQAFQHEARRAGFQLPAMEPDQDGVRLERE